jgi:dienelactone hydrolase
MIRQFLFTLILAGMVLVQVQAQPEGQYTGHIEIMGQQIDIETRFQSNGSDYEGMLSIPAQGAHNLKMNTIQFNDPAISFRVDTVTSHLEFDGKYFAEGDSLAGTFRQSGFEGTFLLKHKEKEASVDWIQKEVAFYNDTIKLAGTLSLPDQNGKYPAVILLSGSGQQTRDENVMGFKIFKQLEEYFISRNIAVLRYDDRGAGKSDNGNVAEATSEDLAGDALAAYQYLKTSPYIYTDNIGMMGHSEGSLLANMVAQKANVAFVVMMAGPVMPGHKLLMEQSRSIMQAEGQSKETIKNNLQTNQAIYQEVMKENTNHQKIENLLRESFSQADSAQREQMISQQMQFLAQPWLEFFLQYDPAKPITSANYPILAVFGGKDTQVPEKPNMKELKKIMQNNPGLKIDTLVFDDANHLFQKADSGSPSEYSKLDKAFIGGFKEQVADWILKEVVSDEQ